jgi:transposase
MDAREERGLVIANTSKIEKNKIGYKVPSQSGNGSYVVNLDHGNPFCTCPDFEKGHKCKHIFAVEFIEKRETDKNGTVTETKTVKITYGQDWTAYNDAQTTEKAQFVWLLADLCNGLTQPEQHNGRPRLPLSDMVFASVFKVYMGFSSRRFTCDMAEANELGCSSVKPHFNSVSNYLAMPELTPILKSLIERSASVLKSVETDFAVDSSGFATTTYDRWFDHKWGKVRSEAKWVKAHLMCGVKTHVVTSVEVTPTETADAPQLPALVNTTARTFQINEVSADKAYSSRNNLRAIQAVNAVPYIPFKSYSKGSQGTKPFDGLWNRMWHFYSFNQEAFLQHYHKRSNIETTMSMIKGKFVLIQSIHELGIEPQFLLPSGVK